MRVLVHAPPWVCTPAWCTHGTCTSLESARAAPVRQPRARPSSGQPAWCPSPVRRCSARPSPVPMACPGACPATSPCASGVGLGFSCGGSTVAAVRREGRSGSEGLAFPRVVTGASGLGGARGGSWGGSAWGCGCCVCCCARSHRLLACSASRSCCCCCCCCCGRCCSHHSFRHCSDQRSCCSC